MEVSSPEPRAIVLARLSPAVLCVLALAAELGRHIPALVEALGVVALASLVLIARARVRRDPPVSAPAAALAVLVFVALALSVATGGRGARIAPDIEPLCRRISVVLALLAGTGMALPFALPWLMQPVTSPRPRPIAPLPGNRAGLAAIAGTWLVFHGVILVTFPPLIWCDSWVNLWEPRLFQVTNRPYLHTPLYAELVRALGEGPHLVAGLTLITVLQHVAVLAIGVVLERLVRREMESRLAGTLAGLVVVIDAFFAFYAQRIATEVLGTAFFVGAIALLVEATWRERAERWILSAGALAAAATLTRPVFQAWFVLGGLWLLAVRPMKPRWRAAAILVFGAAMPIVLLKGHNYVFHGDARLTGQTGKALVYRIMTDMPPLTDPDAAPDDPMERARRIAWSKRDEVWMGPWLALESELGWSDAQIDRAMQQFYFEQVRRHPRAFIETTLTYAVSTLLANDSFASVVDRHNEDRKVAFFGWDAIPPSPDAPAILEAVNSLKITSRVSICILAALAPFVVTGERRRTALLVLASAAYAIVLAALVLGAMSRTRLPAMPLLGVALAMTVAGVLERLGARGAVARPEPRP